MKRRRKGDCRLPFRFKKRCTKLSYRRKLSTASRRGIAHSAIQILPGVAAEKPDADCSSPREDHPEREMRPRLYRRRSDARKIPLREGPHKLAVQTNRQQGDQEQTHQRQYSHAHRIKQHHRPVVDTSARLRFLGCASRRDYLSRSSTHPLGIGFRSHQWR